MGPARLPSLRRIGWCVAVSMALLAPSEDVSAQAAGASGRTQTSGTAVTLPSLDARFGAFGPPATTGAPLPALAAPQEIPLDEPLPVSPGGAFLRAVLVPGWGHAAIGAHGRGGFYFALEAATAYTFLRTRARLSEARNRAALRESVVRARLADAGITAAVDIEEALGQDEPLAGFQALVDSRESQQEDLVAWGIFLLFLSGADAYVSAHLGRFPEPIEVQVDPVASDRAEVSLRVPLPNLP